MARERLQDTGVRSQVVPDIGGMIVRSLARDIQICSYAFTSTSSLKQGRMHDLQGRSCRTPKRHVP